MLLLQFEAGLGSSCGERGRDTHFVEERSVCGRFLLQVAVDVRLGAHLLVGECPRVAQRHPEHVLFGREAVEQEFARLAAHQRHPDGLAELAEFARLGGRALNERQRLEQVVHELGRVRVVNVRLELGEQVERVLELLKDVHVLALVGQQGALLGLVGTVAAAFARIVVFGRREDGLERAARAADGQLHGHEHVLLVLGGQYGDEELDVVEALVQVAEFDAHRCRAATRRLSCSWLGLGRP